MKAKRTVLILALGLVLGLPSVLFAQSDGTEGREGAEAPRIEVVFVLDTTGSMSGLIEGAKRKIWSIANAIATGMPSPLLRMGLVVYRDKGDAYITKVTPLTDDLDKIFKDLSAAKAAGGGDGPEHVNQALHDAVHKTNWSGDEDALKIIFLVGDAPPHMDYGDDVDYPKTVEEAVKRNIMVNTVQCGNNGRARAHWQKIARSGEGKYVAIRQDGGMVSVSTPYDEKLVELEREMASTRIAYGSVRARAAAEVKKSEADDARKTAESLAPGVAADRAVATTSGPAACPCPTPTPTMAGDLVTAVGEKGKKLEEIDEKQLPEAFRKLSKEEREAKVKELLAKRKLCQARIKELAAKRSAFVQKELKKRGASDGFDAKVIDMIRDRAKEKGVSFR
ncbi:MAG: vWA domain-containing protein [Planctomycetota bacterium]|jgi:uncharacterized protein YegL